MIETKCIDCGTKICSVAKRCNSCNTRSFWKIHPELRKKQLCCIDCGKKLTSSGFPKRCKKCYRVWQSIPENNINWKDGRSFEPYTSEFTETLKNIIRNRDNHECQNCGMTEEEHLIVWGRVSDVHHINYDKQNCKENNLITLCISCNIRANYNRDYWENLYQNKVRIL